VIEWNLAAERIFGYSREEAIGEKMANLIIPERYREHHLRGINHFLKTQEGPVLKKQIEIPALKKDGSEFPSELYISPINIDGRVLFTGTLRDITERKQAEKNLIESEKRFRDVADSAPVMIWMSDAKNETVYVNKPWTDFTGLDAEMLAGKTWTSIVHPEDLDRAVEEFKGSFKQLAPITMVYRLKKKTGEYRWVLDTGIPRKLNDGSFVGYIGSVVDINDQKLKEDQLQYQATILENVSDIIVSSELNGTIKSWNKAAEEFYGITEHQAIGRMVTELVKIDYQTITREKALEQLFNNGIWKGEVAYRNKQGEVKYLLNTISLVINKDSERIGVLTVGRDITERKQAEEKLKQSEQFHRTLIADSANATLLMDADGTISFASEAVKILLGYESAEVVGKNAFEFVNPEDMGWAIRSFEREVGENPEVKSIVVRLKKKDGSWMWCMVRGHNMLDNPYIKSIVVYFHDDTQRKKVNDALKESEKRFRKLVSDLKIGVVLSNKDAETIMCNKAMAAILQTTEEDLIGKSIFGIASYVIHEDGRQFTMEERPLNMALKTKLPTKNVVVGVHLPKNDSRIWLMISCVPVLDDNNEILHVVSSVYDITERKQLEQALIADQVNHQKQLMHAYIDAQEEERKEIGKELHDNIGQLLTTTKLYLDLAKSTADDTTNEMVSLSLKSISDVINEVRHISHSLIPPTLGDLGLIDSIKDLVETFTRMQPLEIQFNYPFFDEGKLPENQKLMLFRIIQEQLNNIVKHANANVVFITLRNIRPLLLLEIRDDGKGFDSTKIRKGIGLANMKNRAELFGGKIEIISAYGEGCTLKVMVPHGLQ
ncbi:MAG TPA: PAS domain S-box protein, partial [Chitinophagaceae bacterium]|nr:PAS domain S-box protein [Chitinophagaceae bacterium]